MSKVKKNDKKNNKSNKPETGIFLIYKISPRWSNLF